ncbi:thermonuclease family protein [Rhodospirillum rubrum]|uniref:Nuclease (SNase-like) n=1 Tax=Rhodospirillum rubrum (strain ATCC 11170 / ATH 1.1.1 / DSM 467 / LMG 4362 / NCIMB 8255 / S1) TaxID=269796 RepID=Q2RPW5_RHORT|nr:thermonuclease family protein [Rhodospirillum rubrum]ABC23830.1 nuclease (SNase-like) [Rhodospirillum rubrum ATCC 11170]AEO49572.1 SNase-like nuclease [Rhodospirillum rubrum F11]MBK5955506.1 nuclease [Rhodospirillum rubrum]QXG79778.1 thermonuclease family protein [Rhodospirillum rubrum]
MKSFVALALGFAVLHAPLARAECYQWPLREHQGRVVYDGDTLYTTLPGAPAELAAISVRIRGIDTAEIRAKCDEERYQATAARDYLEHLLSQGQPEFCEVAWDKYGGRVDATVRVGGKDIATEMVRAGFARSYSGGARASWCG